MSDEATSEQFRVVLARARSIRENFDNLGVRSQGYCKELATALVLACADIDIFIQLCQGVCRHGGASDSHYWCVAGEKVIDLSADQFDSDLPGVYVANYVLPSDTYEESSFFCLHPFRASRFL
ncbi:MAG: hypothetical protein AAGB51_11045 [Planctomycetota bacterium]